MKKFKFISVIVCVLMLTTILTGCNLFKEDYKSFTVQYTSGLKLLLGEEWHDDLIKGTITKSDDTTEDVTSKMVIDTSEYNKDQVGKYKIYFKFKKSKASYEVEVVDELTDVSLVSSRLNKVMENSLTAKDGVLEFDAQTTTLSVIEGEFLELRQEIYYRENDGVFTIYYLISMLYNDEPIVEDMEFWYVGTDENGLLSIDYNDPEYENDIDEPVTFNEFEEGVALYLEEISILFDSEVICMNTSELFEFRSANIYVGELTKYEDLYTFMNSDIIITYVDNKLESINDVYFDFDTINEIPSAPVAE